MTGNQNRLANRHRMEKEHKERPRRVELVIKKFAVDLGIRLGYGTAFFLLFLSYLLTLYANSELLKQARLVDHTNRIIVHLEGLSSSVKDAETGVRGFIIMKDTAFLSPYWKGRSTVDSLMNFIRRETENSPDENKRLNSLGQLISNKFEELSFVVQFYPTHNFELTDTVKTKAWWGNQQMDHIRTMVHEFQFSEQTLLRERSQELNTRYVTLNTIVVTSLVIAFLLVIYGFITYARENKARRRADETVFHTQEQLKERINQLGQANTELIQMRSIEKLAATGRIARTIAHEVRNPLTNINLSVDQLKSSGHGEAKANHSLMLDMISRNSNRINQLITELLNSTKFTELVFQKISVSRILDETLDLALDRIRLKRIQVKKSYQRDLGELSVDVEKIKIAFLNIIVNAIEAMEPEKGILQIQTENKAGKCVVTISDNGSGMNEESMARLFEPYFTSKAKGTGLGLTNTQNIILNHNGNIRAESELGKGTRFIITLNFT
jgi:signal transduction histidine kinase